MESNGVSLAISSLIFYHHLFAFLLPIVFFYNLLVLFLEKNYAKLNKKIWLAMPLIFLLLSANFLLGVTIWAMLHFALSWRVVVMIAVMLIVLVAEIGRKNHLKISRISEAGMKRYIKRCKILYGFEILLFVIAGLIL